MLPTCSTRSMRRGRSCCRWDARREWSARPRANAALHLQFLTADPRSLALQDVTERFTLQPLLASPVDQAVTHSYAIHARIDALLAAAGHDQVYPG